MQQDRARNPAALPTEMILLYAVFFLLPFAICFVLLSSRKVEFIAAGAGVACVFFGAFLVVSPYVLRVMALFLGMSAWGKRSADYRSRGGVGRVPGSQPFDCLVGGADWKDSVDYIRNGDWFVGTVRAFQFQFSRFCGI